MSTRPRTIVFLVNLVQDVAIFAPILDVARSLDGTRLLFLYTLDFVKRDAGKVWMEELARLASESRATLVEVAQARDAILAMQDKRGLLLSASETDLPHHQLCSEIVRGCPSSFTTVSLQHGFENIGLLHNEAHDTAFGSRIGFGADIVAAWFAEDRLYSMKPSERAKLFVAGPPMLIGQEDRAANPAIAAKGLICENLHSVRMRGGDTQQDFLATLASAAALAAARSLQLEVRPHPGGQYLRRQKVALPSNVVTNTAPLYRQQLGSFRFGISAPSSVLLDLIFADVPVAVWQNAEGSLALGNYAGLPVVSDAADWMRFAEQAAADRDALLARQARFVAGLGIPGDVRDRYRLLLSIDADAMR